MRSQVSAETESPVGVAGTVVVEFETVTVRAGVVNVFPATSVTTAVIEREPFATVVEFHDTEYGEVVSVATVAPSTLNATLATPESASLADAEMVTAVPETVVLAAGAVIEPVGATLSSLNVESALIGFSTLLTTSRE